MRKTVIAAVAALGIAGLGAGTLVANAQPAAPPGPPPGPGFAGPHGPHPHWGAWMRRMREARRPFAPGTFALVYRHADRHLTPADVQTIAQAFLLWHGNHSWKVVDVAPAANGQIGFAYATKQGGVIARFTMNPHTGHIERVD